MPRPGFDTPVLLVIFNRPDTTRRVFESVRSIRPTRLFVAGDGPRSNVSGEGERCEEARRTATAVDWQCEVQTYFRPQNAGLAVNVSGAITWFFENVEEGIILEDDCIPSRSFYMFCEELLRYYREQPYVMHISGNNFQYGRRRGSASYYFSKYPLIWGWATWRRAWRLYDFSLRPSWELHDTWDTQWQLTLEKHGGMAVTPQVNLVTNVGFGPGASHTKTLERFSNLPALDIEFPMIHPGRPEIDSKADEFLYYAHFRNVPSLRFLWAFRVWDRTYALLKRAKQFALGRRPA